MSTLAVTLDAVCLAARIILESGGETHRAEETVERMAFGLNVPTVDVLAFPTGFMLTLQTDDETTVSRIVRVRHRSNDFSRLDACNSISRQVAAGQLDAEAAYHALQALTHSKQPSLTLFIAAGALSSGFFTLMLGGNWLDFIISCLCGALAQFLLPRFTRHKIQGALHGLLVGFSVTTIALLCQAVLPSLVTESIIGGAIMPFLPGLSTTNAIRDTLEGDLVSGSARLSEAMLNAAMVSVGICLGLSIW